MPKVIGPMDPQVPIEINISGMTPHVFAYKLWWRDAANNTWMAFGQGNTGDQLPDFLQRPFTKGAQLFHWIGVAGRQTSQYDGIITVAQNGKVMQNGLIHVTGQTNAKGVDVQQDWANFL
jgi:hypothetical protein